MEKEEHSFLARRSLLILPQLLSEVPSIASVSATFFLCGTFLYSFRLLFLLLLDILVLWFPPCSSSTSDSIQSFPLQPSD